MLNRTVKTTLIAAVAVLVTASTSMAATYAYIGQDTNVKKHHKHTSMNVNHVSYGEKVKIVGQWNNWVKIQIPGPDGWVKKGTLINKPWPNNNPWPNNGNGGQVCFNGQYGSLCLSSY